ncbi:MAG: ABC-2 family transporter protein [bacterium]|nr:ABC-2 family transporter protein [bacterium]
MYRLHLIWTFFRIGILNELAYQINFYVQFLQSLLSLGTALAGLAIVFSHTNDLGGWRAVDILALLGVYLMVGGAIRMVIQPSMSQFMEDVRQGTLDFTLTKPEDAQFLISISQIRIWKLTDIILGLIVLGVALSKRGLEVSPFDVASFALVMITGGAIIYSFWLILATLTFWFIRITNILIIFQTMYEAGRWPIGIYPQWLRLILTFIVPIAFAVTVPAEALSGRLTLPTLILSVALAIAMLTLSRWFWSLGIKNYSGASA